MHINTHDAILIVLLYIYLIYGDIQKFTIIVKIILILIMHSPI